MMNFLLLCVALFSCHVAFGQTTCPAIYLRFSKDHTYCRHSTCVVEKSGVSDSEKEIILKMHNEFRSKIAMGKETTPVQQPSAANMMQMSWDDELAKVAQAHANGCKFAHDTGPQRQVENFSVGQNLYITMMSKRIDWKKAALWYTSEVKDFYPQYREPFVFGSYGHFSQMVWAKTWKVGCGVAMYYDNTEKMEKVLYTCNYGPAGNMQGGTMYIKGQPCSQCPKNTECSAEYEGLCKPITEDGPQNDIAKSSNEFIFYCDFSVSDPSECRNVKVEGSRHFETRKIYSGQYKTVVLNGGESITIKLGKAQNAGGICPFIYGSFGPNRDGDVKKSAVSFGFSAPGYIFGDPVKIEYGGSTFWTIGMRMMGDQEMESTIKLEAYPGAAPQYFNVKAFGIGKGKCPRF